MKYADNSTSINGYSCAGRLLRAGLLAALIGALAASTALAGPQLGTIEECLESGTDLVSLPGVAGGTLSARECTTCETHRLAFTQKTRFFIGKEAVAYVRFRAAASKGPLRLYVFYRPDTRALTRLRLDASAGATQQ
jgi:hypothetical protein